MTAQARRRPEPFPKSALYGAGALIAFSLVAVGVSRLVGWKMDWVPPATTVAERQVTFTRVGEGGLEVRDARSGTLLGEYDRDTDAFVRTVFLGLLHDRSYLKPGDKSTAFALTRWNDGRVTISDPVSGRSIELAAFGRTQVETFEKLLD